MWASYVAIGLALVALVVSLAIPGPQGPVGRDGADGADGADGLAGPTGPQGPPGPAPNVVSMDALAACTGTAVYTVNVWMINLGASAMSFSFSIRYFRADGTTLVQTSTYGPYALGPWELDTETIEQGVSSDGCSYPHLVWDGSVKVIGWRR